MTGERETSLTQALASERRGSDSLGARAGHMTCDRAGHMTGDRAGHMTCDRAGQMTAAFFSC